MHLGHPAVYIGRPNWGGCRCATVGEEDNIGDLGVTFGRAFLYNNYCSAFST